MPTVELVSGSVLRDRYRIEAKIGRGAFGSTYRALDLERFNEPRVIKTLHAHLDRAERARALFEREARVLAGIKHPLIPHLHHFFEQDGEFYLVEDYIAGESWEQVLRQRGPIREEDAITIASDVLDVLKYLHTRDPIIIHRDIKPSNLMRRTSDGRTLLVDFGAVREVLETADKTVIGTNGFAPPEQADGAPVASSDLYALGGTLLQLLTSRPPTAFHDLITGKVRIEGRVTASAPFVAVLAGLFAELGERYQSAAHAEAAVLVARDSLTARVSAGGIVTSSDSASSSVDSKSVDTTAHVLRNFNRPEAPPAPVRAVRKRSNRPAMLVGGALAVIAISFASVSFLSRDDKDATKVSGGSASGTNPTPSAANIAASADVTSPARVSSGSTTAGYRLEISHPGNWTPMVASTGAPEAWSIRNIAVTPDPGALGLRLPGDRGGFVFGLDSYADATLPIDRFIESWLTHLLGTAVVADPARPVGADVYQAVLKSSSGAAPVGMVHVKVVRETAGSQMFWKLFLGDVSSEAKAVETVISGLRVTDPGARGN